MTYELALKLKKAGFPFGGDNSIEGVVPHPTLSELIEACGDEFSSIVRMTKDWNSRDGWRTSNGRFREELEEGVGDTPEEAVANLYLALFACPICGKRKVRKDGRDCCYMEENEE